MPPEVDQLAGQVQAIHAAALSRLKSAMPFLVRWRDRIVYSLVLAAGLGAIAVAITRDGSTGGIVFAAAAVVLFAFFGGYDRLAEQVPEFSADERRELVRLLAAISQRMKGVDEPMASYWRPRRPTLASGPCGWCGSTSQVYGGHYEPFSPAGTPAESACYACLRQGRGALRVTEGELHTLRGSIMTREPDLSSADLDRRMRSAAEELRRTPAPPFATDWPQCCCDFCRFEGAWDVGDFAVASGSFDVAILAGYIDHACGHPVERSAVEAAAHSDALVSIGGMWQVFRCRSCNRLFATSMSDQPQS